jgi:flagellar hook-associated protein 1 FlgK
VQSTFSGIELGKRSLFAHNRGLSTIGHNMSNASTEGYSRQRVEFQAAHPIYMPGLSRAETPGQIGQGVNVERVERIRDNLLEGRIVAQANGQGYWEVRDKYLLMVEQTYNEPSEYSVRSLMDSFWKGWQELSIHPEQTAARKTVLQRGETLIDGIHQQYRSLKQIRDMLEDDVEATVETVNELTAEIADLNEEILKVKAAGDNPNDFLDRRDLLVERLAGLIDITRDTRDPDEFTIHSGGIHIVQGRIHRPLRLEPDPNDGGYSRVVWADTGDQAVFRGGKLAGLVELRDGDVRREIQKLNNMTINFVDLVNEIHRDAYGLNGITNQDFFVEQPFVGNLAGNYDRDGDGEYDATYVFRITGTNALDPQEQIGLQGTLTLPSPDGTFTIDYFPTDTVGDLVERINNSPSEVVARLDRNRRLSLKATPAENPENPDFVIRSLQDSGQFLVGYAGILQESGPDGAYTWEQADAVLQLRGGGLDYAVAPLSHPAGWIEVNPELLQDPSSVAAGFGRAGRPANPGDGSAALAIAALRNQPVMVGQISSFDDYFADAVAEIGLKGEEAEIALETQNVIMKDLRDTRAAISGVNLDEELSEMVKFQHGYQAAARFVSEVNQMLDTIINRMGV